MASGNKTIFAHTLSVEGNFNYGDTSTEDKPLEMLSFGVKKGVVDVTFRNKNRHSSLLHRAELLVEQVRPVPDSSRCLYSRMAATYEYHLLLNLEDKFYQLELAQEIPAGRLDRFRIILGLARGDSYYTLHPPFMPGRGQTAVTHAYFQGTVKFYCDADQTIVAPSQKFVLPAFQFGHPAPTMPAVSYLRNLEMLKHQDGSVVAQAIDALVQAKEPSALPSLKDLRKEIRQRRAQDTALSSGQWADPWAPILEEKLDGAIKSIERNRIWRKFLFWR